MLDSSEIEAIVDWQCHTMVHEVKSFMGIVGSYRRFVEGFYKTLKSTHGFDEEDGTFIISVIFS